MLTRFILYILKFITISLLLIVDCHLPPYAGPCNSKFQRYFYNKTSKRCETFTYGGCNKNKNNFYYQYDCENECGGKIPLNDCRY